MSVVFVELVALRTLTAFTSVFSVKCLRTAVDAASTSWTVSGSSGCGVAFAVEQHASLAMAVGRAGRSRERERSRGRERGSCTLLADKQIAIDHPKRRQSPRSLRRFLPPARASSADRLQDPEGRDDVILSLSCRLLIIMYVTSVSRPHWGRTARGTASSAFPTGPSSPDPARSLASTLWVANTCFIGRPLLTSHPVALNLPTKRSPKLSTRPVTPDAESHLSVRQAIAWPSPRRPAAPLPPANQPRPIPDDPKPCSSPTEVRLLGVPPSLNRS